MEKFRKIVMATEEKKAMKVRMSAAWAPMGQGRAPSQTCLMKELGRVLGLVPSCAFNCQCQSVSGQ